MSPFKISSGSDIYYRWLQLGPIAFMFYKWFDERFRIEFHFKNQIRWINRPLV